MEVSLNPCVFVTSLKNSLVRLVKKLCIKRICSDLLKSTVQRYKIRKYFLGNFQ